MSAPRFTARRHRRGVLAALAAVSTLILSLLLLGATGPAAQAADPVTYIGTQTIPVPPASTYAGSGGGDGWAIELSATEVFNVFHHQGSVTVACHKQSDATPCYAPRTLTDGSGHSFGASAHPGLHYDAGNQKLYVFTARDDNTGGVVCFDTVLAATSTNPFCGFTPLTAVGHATYGGTPFVSEPVLVGNRWFAYNWSNGLGAGGDQNALLCFDMSSHAACAGQPFSPALGGTTVNVASYPSPSVARINGRVLVGFAGTAAGNAFEGMTCFDPATNATCTGTWPVTMPTGYTSQDGAPFPLLNAAGNVLGFCLPSGTDPCWNLTGTSVPTPAGMASAITPNEGWNGGAFVIGSRVYLANGTQNNVVQCYNAATDASCASFPKSFANLGYIYTVNPDPARPACVWVNADYGSQQIQNFDAFTGGACGEGPIRVLASSFVVNAPECTPGSYSSIEIVSPPRSSYADGSIKFLDGDAAQLPIADRPIDATGTVDLHGLGLNSAAGLPQFLVTLNGAGAPSAVTVRLTWTGQRDPGCVLPGTVVQGDVSVDAGPDVTGAVGADLALHGTATATNLTSTSWSLPAGTPCTVTTPSAPHTTVRCTAPGSYVATLRASDPTTTVSDTTTIHVTGGTGGGVTPRCHGQRATIVGTAGDDGLVGTSGPDVIVGGSGDDVIDSGGGDDVICAGDGDDDVNGHGGSDFVNGGDGRDIVDGGEGHDVVVGRDGRDTISGEGGRDDLNGNAGGDRLDGGAAPDELNGNSGDDVLVGGSGHNTLLGGPDLDTCGTPSDGPDVLFGCEVDNT